MSAILFILTYLSVFTGEQDAFLKAMAAFNSKDYVEAIDSFSSVIESDANNYELYLYRGECYYYTGKMEDAITDFTNADRIKSNCADIWLGRCYAILGNQAEAIKYIGDNLKSRNKTPLFFLVNDTAFAALKDTKSWTNLMSGVSFTRFEQSYNDVLYELSIENFEGAISILDKLTWDYPQKYKVWQKLAEIYFSMKEYRLALENIDEAIKQNKRNTDLYFLRAQVLFQTGKNRKALSDCDFIIGKTPELFSARLLRAKLYVKAEKFDKALEDILFYQEYFPDDKKVVFQTGELFYQKGDYLEALKYFNQLAEENKTNPVFYIARGKTYLKANTPKRAYNDFGMALDLEPRNAACIYLHGVAAKQLNRRHIACADWKKAKRLGYAKAAEALNANACRE